MDWIDFYILYCVKILSIGILGIWCMDEGWYLVSYFGCIIDYWFFNYNIFRRNYYENCML